VQEDDYLSHCVADITRQLQAVPAKKTPGVSAINLAGCKLLIATWEAEAFNADGDDLSRTLRRAVAARTILHVSVERLKKNVPTDLSAAIEIAETSVEELRQQVALAKQSENIDAAVNLAATTKRLLALIEEGVRLRS
jgi:copper chaperone CopZ